MYTVRKRYRKFYELCDDVLQYLNIRVVDCNKGMLLSTKEVPLFLTGTLNILWQSWNSLWRVYWLANLYGGLGINRDIIPSGDFSKSKHEEEAIFYLLYLLGRKKRANGRSRGSFEEVSWGDKNVIESLSLILHGENSDILTYIGQYGDAIKHLQIVRNASIHLDKYNVRRINNDVLPHYTISTYKYPWEIIFARDLSNGKPAIQNWIDDLTVFIKIVS